MSGGTFLRVGEPDKVADRSAWRDLPRNVWVLSLTSLLRDVASEMLVHLVPLFMVSVLGGAPWQGLGGRGGFGPGAAFLFGSAMALVAGLLLWFWVPAPKLGGA